jgi:uncharacterized membrane protein
MVHINNLLMLIAVGVFATAHTKGQLRGWTRHPMLLGVVVWGAAHLLVNGDLASILLFGSMVLWALISIVAINRAQPEWEKPERGDPSRDKILFGITIVAFALIAGIHNWLGVWPFPQ